MKITSRKLQLPVDYSQERAIMRVVFSHKNGCRGDFFPDLVLFLLSGDVFFCLPSHQQVTFNNLAGLPTRRCAQQHCV
jgi:hypothetical protein